MPLPISNLSGLIFGGSVTLMIDIALTILYQMCASEMIMVTLTLLFT